MDTSALSAIARLVEFTEAAAVADLLRADPSAPAATERRHYLFMLPASR